MSSEVVDQLAGERGFVEALTYTLKLCSLPSFFMLLGSLLVMVRQPSSTFVQMTQHLGAGIVLSAVATELVPQMSMHAKDKWGQSAIATLVGFSLGVIIMIAVEHFTGEDEEGKEDEESKAASRHSSVESQVSANATADEPKRNNRRRSLLDAFRRSSVQDTTVIPGDSDYSASPVRRLRHHHHHYHTHKHHDDHHHHGHQRGHDELDGSGKSAASKETTSLLGGQQGAWANVPWTLTIAVFVDSFMDGLLIGISAVAGKNAGLIMTIALTIEMTFLGLTFSAGTSKISNNFLRYALIVGAPLMILVGGGAGSLAAAALAQNPILQIGLIAFGVAALLYLVTEELLIEAHENGEGHKWYVDSCFFGGFISSVLLEQAVQGQ